MNRLPSDVAYEVAHKLQDMIRINGIKKLQPSHFDVAHKIVHANLLADTIAWYQWIRGIEA